ncbi:hypothetical protein [Sulfolobus acidocaldarius]|uniref:Conserved Archaeal protein n=4 Tax=Sulfolobus acidocaldarius TaxID=2285 RepID=Q4JAC2_SULAC|nr:hypothetical protein [Sulfolobus acidocaldarius]AAY80258.1 conserved Archaeal protein [Sulfolobus acidocaldarius DSM 639]AGE70838.1 hypothetical protein SacN8_04335 [Sulfolobus acidocaldarius N8]AGE73109.1 hypothetical protein SacRon12I_04325 [Sulfolobus acidocaldarius Ron12/I]ALU28849.1 hypothetical protein ATY89_01955 [Sulfolobus acidocaldarius]ALU31568.1 hypothetical protein ATZ20_04990 [Sulfolobus acidocaldarius]
MVKKVAIDVNDLKLYHKLILRLRQRNINLEENPQNAEIIITEDLVKKLGIDKTIGYLVCKLRGKEYFNELLIGIDANVPNKLSVAVLGDGELVESNTIDLKNIKNYLNEIIKIYPHKTFKIGIGNGNLIGKKLYESLRGEYTNLKLVDENRSSLKNPFIIVKDRDIRAAYIIALRAAI